MIKLKDLITENEQSQDTFQMYHGGKRWSYLPTEILPSKGGRYEGGVGIYLTNSYETAQKYAKGSRVVQLVSVNKNFKDLDTVNVPLSDITEFVKNCRGMRRKDDIINSLKRNAERMQRDTVSLDILNNLIVNYEAGSGNAGVDVAKYFVGKGADAHVDKQSGDEEWLVVFNPKIITKVTVVNPRTVTSDFTFMLPKIGR